MYLGEMREAKSQNEMKRVGKPEPQEPGRARPQTEQHKRPDVGEEGESMNKIMRSTCLVQEGRWRKKTGKKSTHKTRSLMKMLD